MNSAGTPPPLLSDQFQALQEALEAGDAAGAAKHAELLLGRGLAPVQRALVLQLEGSALLQRNRQNSAAVIGLWHRSLALRFSPQLALQCLELELLPAVPWAEQPRWMSLMQRLIDRGYGPDLLQWLTAVLEQLPLEQQRRELLEGLAPPRGLSLERDPRLIPLWKRLCCCADWR